MIRDAHFKYQTERQLHRRAEYATGAAEWDTLIGWWQTLHAIRQLPETRTR